MTIKATLAQVEAQLAKYDAPEAVRSGVIWLHSFMHSRCNGAPAKVAEILRRINPQEYPNKEQYIYQTARGSYFRKSSGAEAIETFNEIVDRLKQWDILEQQRGRVPFNENLRAWKRYNDYVTAKRARSAVCKFGAIQADTGLGKTACTKHYTLLNNHGLTVRIEMPSAPTLARFLVKLGSSYNISASLPTSARLIEIDEQVTSERVIIVENCQKAYHPQTGTCCLPIFSYLQELQDDRDCTVILTWTPVFATEVLHGKESRYFEQFVSRIGGYDDILVLPKPNKADLLSIVDQFEIRDRQGALAMLAEWSRQPGCLRLIYDRLQKAKVIARNRDLTLNHLEISAATTTTTYQEEDAP